MKAKDFLNELRHDEIVAAIRQAEQTTSGEIRVFISRHEPDDIMAAAQTQFTRLEMNKTAERNGVLIYVAPRVRKFAIIGDTAVHERCGNVFWEAVATEMTTEFKQSRFTEGILHAIGKAGQLLAQHFPAAPGNKNELSDDVEHD